MSKTREMLIDVARQLFAKSGVENTTMNDIALASQKGRRTLYTYFKSKNEVYWAVVESELDHILRSLQEMADQDLSPEKKLVNYIYARMEAMKEAVLRNGTLRAEFFRDIWKVEQARKYMDLREIQLIKGILDEGVNKNVFAITNTSITASIVHYALKGLDVPYIKGHFNESKIDKSSLKNYIMNFILNGIKKQ
ncbi:MAG: TetR family transcriptional regulator [Bacteroidaceae bacterium]|nr:TetR family transcriptional regulator [Bacteroidaceae bacterium]